MSDIFVSYHMETVALSIAYATTSRKRASLSGTTRA